MASIPIARGSEAVQVAGVRVVGIAFLALVAAIALCWPSLVPVAAVGIGGLYGAELALSDAPLDVAAPAIAAGLFLSVELGYWSIEERGRWTGESGESLRRGALIALLAAGAALVASVLLALVDAFRTTGLAVDLLGAAAAAAAIVAVAIAVERRDVDG